MHNKNLVDNENPVDASRRFILRGGYIDYFIRSYVLTFAMHAQKSLFIFIICLSNQLAWRITRFVQTHLDILYKLREVLRLNSCYFIISCMFNATQWFWTNYYIFYSYIHKVARDVVLAFVFIKNWHLLLLKRLFPAILNIKLFILFFNLARSFSLQSNNFLFIIYNKFLITPTHIICLCITCSWLVMF